MKKISPLHWIYSRWRNLPLTDRCLLLFMCILLLQAALTLFFHDMSSTSTQPVDTMMRTTAAAVFGYFISGGYGGGQDAKQKEKINPAIQAKENDSKTELPCPCGSRRSQEQVLIITGIGLFSLITLILARNHTQLTPLSTAAMSQLRDFVSGSVGFLIGHPEKKEK